MGWTQGMPVGGGCIIIVGKRPGCEKIKAKLIIKYLSVT